MIRATRFYEQFKSEVEANICLAEYRKGGTEFTKQITEIINNIIKNSGLCPENEYYRIDAIGWSDHKDLIEDEAVKARMKPHLWDLEIAVEHENDIMDWTDELIKLLHISCPLKVIIGYNYCDGRDAYEQEKLLLATNLMHHVKAFQRSQLAYEQYLIILGNARAMNGQSCYQSFDYRGYVYNYDLGKFEMIQ